MNFWMKKTYEKPAILCETLTPEAMLCGCRIKNPNLNEEWHCSFDPDGLGLTLFAQNWDSCQFSDADLPDLVYCYHAGTVNVFGS